MPIIYRKTVAAFEGTCAVEEAEELMLWLKSNPGAGINLKKCEHLHTSVLQVIMAFRPKFGQPPADPLLKGLTDMILSTTSKQEF